MRKLLVVLLSFLLLVSAFGCTTKNEPEEEVYDRGNFFSYLNQNSSYYNTAKWDLDSNVGKLDTTVDKAAKAKRTTIKGNNKDKITILVYMCGSDLESQGSMASYDLQEMATATLGSNINLIVYTGGTTKWAINGISTKYNQIYQVTNGKLSCLVENAGTGSMVDPDTLVEFLEFGKEHYSANRMELIFWDHGGGSVSGYGYDLKYPKLGSMTLDQIDEALTKAGIKFDFIGFDACLMANTETALMLTEHADYLIASEESEPGIGWYYTDWLNALAKNTSMPTIEIGKNIADTFVSTCKSQTPRQAATLSVVDLAEVAAVLSDKLSAFSKSATNLINNNQYKTVSSARSGAREFAEGNGVDLVDLVDLANGVGTTEAKELVNAILGCVKYNNTSNSMTDAYGLSIYFPYSSTKYVNTMLNTYNKIDMNADYSSCIKTFVSYQATGQVASGGQHTAQQSFSSYNTSQYTSQSSGDLITELLNAFLTTGESQQQGSQQTGQQQGSQQSSGDDPYAVLLNYGINLLLNSMFNKGIGDYVANNHFDVDLTWKNGKIALTERQWSMVDDLKLNVFIDDGEGYIDLGTDYVFDVDEKGNLLQIKDMTWLAASTDEKSWQIIPYYYSSSTIDGDNIITTGRIPVLLNDQQANLIVYMDNDVIEVVGVTYDYDDVDVIAKNLSGLNEGDVVKFLCDYYTYDGSFVDSYVLGDALTITSELYLGDVYVSGYNYLAAYQFTDIYQQNYWTTPMK